MNRIRSTGRVLRSHPRLSGLALVILLAAMGGGFFLGVSTSSDASTTVSQTTTTTETVTTGTLRQSVAATGTLTPAIDDTLTFSSSGVVESVLVTEGQTVAVGQALATINSASLAATAAQAAATVASDQAKVASDVSSSATSAQLAADQAALAAAQTQLTSAQAAVAGATLTSPTAGVIASVGLTVGQSVSGSGGNGGGGTSGTSGVGGATSTTTSTSSAIEVISTDSWLVNATVDASSVDLIKTGDQAQLTVSGSTAAVYGTISSIAVLSSSTGTTASYPVVVAVTGSPSGLHDGETVTVSLIYNQVANAVQVPTAALHRTSTGDTYVDKVVNGKTVQTTVETGITSGQTTQITSGLATGDQVQVTQTRPASGTNSGSTTTRGGTGGTGGGNGDSTGGGASGGFGGPPGGGTGGGGFGG